MTLKTHTTYLDFSFTKIMPCLMMGTIQEVKIDF